MYVCYCGRLTDLEIVEEIRRGARSPSEVALTIGAGKRCGSCWPALDQLFNELGESPPC